MERGKYFWRYQQDRCGCEPKFEERVEHDAKGRPFYGFTLVVTVLAHTGPCPLGDTVLGARVQKVTTT